MLFNLVPEFAWCLVELETSSEMAAQVRGLATHRHSHGLAYVHEHISKLLRTLDNASNYGDADARNRELKVLPSLELQYRIKV